LETANIPIAKNIIAEPKELIRFVFVLFLDIDVLTAWYITKANRIILNIKNSCNLLTYAAKSYILKGAFVTWSVLICLNS